MDINWHSYLTPIATVVLTALASILAKVLYNLIQSAGKWLQQKLGMDTYNQALEVAMGIYISLEDKYRDSAVKMGDVKKAEMRALLLQRFPSLTEVELESINKSVWLAFNKSWDEEVNKHQVEN